MSSASAGRPGDPTTALPVRLTVAGPLAEAFAGSEALVCARVEAEVVQVMAEMGVSGRAKADLDAVTRPAAGPERPAISLVIDGRQVRYPPIALSEALAYRDGTPAGAPDPAERLQALASSRDAEGAGEVLASVCRAAAVNAVDLGVPLLDGDASLTADEAPDDLDVHVEPGLLRRLTADPDAVDVFPYVRDQLFADLGLPLPAFRLVRDASLRPGAFAFRINGVRGGPRIGLPDGTVLVNGDAPALTALGVDASPSCYPGIGTSAAIAGAEDQDGLEAAGFTTWTPLGHLILSFAAAIRLSAHTLMTRGVAHELLDRLDRVFPAVADAARRLIHLDDLTVLLRDLLRDRIPIRDLRAIIELLARYETGGAPPGADRVTFVRSGLSHHIGATFAGRTGVLPVWLLEPAIEDALDGRRDGTAGAGEDAGFTEEVLGGVRAELDRLPATGRIPVLLTRPGVRAPLRRLVREEFPAMIVLSYRDLPPRLNVEPLARIRPA